MKTLYIHGWQSSPNPAKIQILEEAGLEVIAPYIDYEKQQAEVYPGIKKLARDEQVEALIGSSMGGFIGYWLAQELNLPALLFNPALYFKSMQPFIPAIDTDFNPPLFICSGEKDETVLPDLLLKYLDQQHPNSDNLKVISAHWLAHQIDIKTFKSMTAWFLSEL
jgi:alpha/beta superfamily hydrolase